MTAPDVSDTDVSQVIVTFYDPREALKLYQWLHANSIRFNETSDMVALQCMKIEKTVVEEVRCIIALLCLDA